MMPATLRDVEEVNTNTEGFHHRGRLATQATVAIHLFDSENDKIQRWDRHSFELESCGITDVFDNLGICLAKDSGFSDVKQLLHPSTYLYALLVAGSCICNPVVILVENLRHLDENSDTMEDRFLISTSIVRLIYGVPLTPIHHLVPMCELICLALLVVRTFKQIIVALCSPCIHSDNMGFECWTTIASLFFESIPALTTFSAMKLLYFVIPSVFSHEAYTLRNFASQRIRYGGGAGCAEAFLSTLWFICSRSFCFIMGIDAFLVKFRMVEVHVNATQLSAYSLACSVVFVFQVLTVVNLRTFVLYRLFLFIFAGEDGKLSLEEQHTMDVWTALFVRQVYKQLGCTGMIVSLLAFSDYNFQLLMLDPNEKVEAHVRRTRGMAAPRRQSL